MAAKEGNTNALKPQTGLQVNFYLKEEPVTELRALLNKQGIEPTKEALREKARQFSKNGIALAIHGLCKVPGCWLANEVTCYVDAAHNTWCPGKFCGYHYGQLHLPPDEIDPIDAITGVDTFTLLGRKTEEE
jgi:hypothetical protein